MKKFVHFLIFIAILSLSCNFATGLFTEPGLVEATGPILDMTVAAALDDQGLPVDAAFTYPADQPQMVVIVRLGEAAPGALTFNWYRVTEAGDEALFEQTVAVEAGDAAFSTGLNPGTLAADTYKVVATFAGGSQTITWDIAELQPVDPAAPEGASASAAGAAPTPGSSGKAPPVVPQPGTQNVSGGTAIPLITGWNVPPFKFQVQSAWIDAQTGAIVIAPTSFKVQVSPAIGGFAAGQSKEFTHPAGVDLLTTYYTLNPCALPGERDVPGTSITVTTVAAGNQAGKETATAILGPDTSAPRIVQLISEPSNRAPVKDGQEIKLTAIAEEIKDGGSWQEGVSKIVIQVMNPSGVAPFSVSYDKYKGKSCTKKSWNQKTEPEYVYKVPKGVKGDVKICAFAEDFAGHKSLEKCYTYPTGKQLQGTLNNGLQQEGPSAGGRYKLAWQEDADLSLSLAPDGTLSGTAQVDYVLDNVHFQSESCGTLHEWVGPVELTLGVSGTWTKDVIDFHYTTDAPIMVTNNFEPFPDCGDTGSKQLELVYLVGERFHAAWDGQAYTADETNDCSADGPCTTTLKIHLAPPAPGVGFSPGAWAVASADQASVELALP